MSILFSLFFFSLPLSFQRAKIFHSLLIWLNVFVYHLSCRCALFRTVVSLFGKGCAINNVRTCRCVRPHTHTPLHTLLRSRDRQPFSKGQSYRFGVRATWKNEVDLELVWSFFFVFFSRLVETHFLRCRVFGIFPQKSFRKFCLNRWYFSFFQMQESDANNAFEIMCEYMVAASKQPPYIIFP